MIRRPPRSTRTDTLFPYTTLFRSVRRHDFFATLPFNDIDRRRDNLFAYGELLVPLASPAQAIGGLHRLSLTGALRFEDYSYSASIVTPKLGIIWARSEERSVGKEGVGTCRSWWSPYH